MKRAQPLLLSLVVLLCCTSFCQAQNWSGVVASSRAIDWSNVGIPGGIPNRTTICATLNPGASTGQINSAIASCPSGQVVKLNAGTYNVSGIDFANHSNVTLRGAGPDQTFLVFSGNASCGGVQADVCIMGDSAYPGSGREHSANWTAGYAKGATQLTFSSTSGMSVGSILVLDQQDDSNTDTGTIWVCQTGGVCADEAPSGSGRAARTMGQGDRHQREHGHCLAGHLHAELEKLANPWGMVGRQQHQDVGN